MPAVFWNKICARNVSHVQNICNILSILASMLPRSSGGRRRLFSEEDDAWLPEEDLPHLEAELLLPEGEDRVWQLFQTLKVSKYVWIFRVFCDNSLSFWKVVSHPAVRTWRSFADCVYVHLHI